MRSFVAELKEYPRVKEHQYYCKSYKKTVEEKVLLRKLRDEWKSGNHKLLD